MSQRNGNYSRDRDYAGSRTGGARRPADPRSRAAAQRATYSSAARSRAAARKKKNDTLKYFGVVFLLAIIIIIAVIQIRTTGKDEKVVSAQTAGTTSADTPVASPTEIPAAVTATEAPVAQVIASPTEVIQETVVAEQATEAPQVTTSSGIATFGSSGEGLRSVRFRFTGDIMVTLSQLRTSYSNGTFDFSAEFAQVAPYLANADFTVANLETTIGKYKDKDYSGYPQFNSPETILGTLKDCGIDMFTLCNNHMLDRWFDGMKNTVNWVEEYGFQHVGAYRTQAERDATKIIEINGIKFGFLAYTTSTNTMEDRGCDEAVKIYGVPYFSRADIDGDVKKLRNAGAEVIICLAHWGGEYIREPDENQQYYAKKLAQAGVDIIIGSHSHMVQPMEYKTFTTSSGASHEVFIIWSMGNFISDHTLKYADCGVILEVNVQEQADGSFRAEDIGIIPLYTWVEGEEDKATVTELVSGDYLNQAPSGMSNSTWARLKESYNDIVSMLGNIGTVLTK